MEEEEEEEAAAGVGVDILEEGGEEEDTWVEAEAEAGGEDGVVSEGDVGNINYVRTRGLYKKMNLCYMKLQACNECNGSQHYLQRVVRFFSFYCYFVCVWMRSNCTLH